MLSTAKSANVGFAPPAYPANVPRAENSFYKFGKRFFFGCQQCAQNY